MSSYIDEEIVERIKDNIDIVDLISDYVQLKKTGANYIGLCPFHNEKTPSFTVSDVKNIFHCFGCGEGGDGVSFIMKRENLDYPQALRFLAEKMNIEIVERQVDDKKNLIKDKTYEINREAALFYYNNLSKIDKPQYYLKKRNINSNTIRRFGLGYALDEWESLYEYLSDKGYKDEEIDKTGLVGRRKDNKGYYDKLRNRIIFPIIDIKARVIGFGGRVIDHTMPKYLNSPDTVVFNKGNHLYGLNLVHKHSDRKKILLVEGYMDVIALFSKGINYSVASLGTALTARQAKSLKRYGEEIFICYDADQAGIKAALKAIDTLRDQEVDPKVILLPDGLDPDDYINKFGLLTFEKEFTKALNHIDFKVRVNKDKYDLEDVDDKVKFTQEIARIIKQLKSPIEQDAYISKISEETYISKDAIRMEIKGNNYKRMDYSSYKKNLKPFKEDIKPIDTNFVSAQEKAEIEILSIIINERDYFDYVDDKLDTPHYSMEESKIIIEKLRKLSKEEEEWDKDVLFSEILEIPNLNRQRLKSIYNYSFEYNATNIDKIIDDLIDTILNSNILNRRKQLLNQIAALESKDRNDEENQLFIDLCLELDKINKQINLRD